MLTSFKYLVGGRLLYFKKFSSCMVDIIFFLKIAGIVLLVLAAFLWYYSYKGSLKFWYLRNMKTFLGIIILLPVLIIGLVVFSSLIFIGLVAFLAVVFVAWTVLVIFGRKRL